MGSVRRRLAKRAQLHLHCLQRGTQTGLRQARHKRHNRLHNWAGRLAAGEHIAVFHHFGNDPVHDQFKGQIVYLDFDGAEGVTYNGPVTVEDINATNLPATVEDAEPVLATEIPSVRPLVDPLEQLALQLMNVFMESRCCKK